MKIGMRLDLLPHKFRDISDAICAETIEERGGIFAIFRRVLKLLQAKLALK